MMEYLQPDQRDISLVMHGALPTCPLCNGTPTTINKVNRETGIYRATVSCSKCACQVGSNFMSREEALSDAINKWSARATYMPAVPTYADVAQMQRWAVGVMQRKPDFIIGDDYLRRWWIVPRNEHQNVYLHHLLRDDDDRALHDHPWPNTSYLIAGRYREITPEGEFIREAGSLVHRLATNAHRLELIDGEPAISVFFTGTKVREWGFHCPKGWVNWRDFTAGDNGELVGRGCGEMG